MDKEEKEIIRFLNECFKSGAKQVEIDYNTNEITILK